MGKNFKHFCEIHTTVCIWDLPDVMNCQFREFAVALLGPVHFLLPDQQSGIHCLIIQLLTANNSGGNRRHMCSPDIRNVCALDVLRNHALQIDIYLLTYLQTMSDPYILYSLYVILRVFVFILLHYL